MSEIKEDNELCGQVQYGWQEKGRHRGENQLGLGAQGNED